MIVTLGDKGAVLYNDRLMNIPAIEAELVDTIGAGDTFDGALAVGISEGMSLEYAILFANKATSISIKGLGTQGGMPFRTLVDSI
ncbi:PfkB family carbohydrate kinase [Macrococcoides bohemicum]|uniref:PfkB family carbohydrate kinase n=1 Tax=Macrococcoides bohemicum TaxID=1903056 RepID=UPI000BB570ED|nr:PfkB family carbohydrate kinase [Macrococcus sp. IME1552]